MKYKKQTLQYDGIIEDYLKQKALLHNNPSILSNYQNRITKLAVHLTKKFPGFNHVNFVETSKIALEMLEKRKRDEVVMAMGNYLNNEFSGSIELTDYLEGIKSNAIVTEAITIKYLAPIENGGKRMKQRKLIVDGRYLINVIVYSLVDWFEHNDIKKNIPKRKKMTVFVDHKVRKDHIPSQYAKVACKSINRQLTSYRLKQEQIMAITIFALENVGLIERYTDYLTRMTAAKQKNDFIDINEYNLFVSRTYTSLMR